MTFRARLVLVATGAVLVVVLLGAVATYVVAYDSLVGSVDVTLEQDARNLIAGNAIGVLPTIENTCGRATGYCSQMVWANGKVHPGDPTVLPITHAVAELAGSQDTGSQLLFTTKVDGISVRQIAFPLAGPYPYKICATCRALTMPFGGVLQVTVPLTGVDEGLRHLFVALWIIILIGVALAVLLGLGVGRAVLAPLNDLTGTVEELARTTDVSRRLDPGGPDELGRLRRAFNRLLAALDSSRESQRQLVLDASHELRTPLTSLRTNMEVARRMEELDPEERDILIGDVLTQLDELTSLVADMAELARGEQPHQTSAPVRCDELGARLGPPHRSGRRQPARQRPQVQPRRRCGRGRVRRRGPRGAGSRTGGGRRRHRPHLRPLLPRCRGPEASGLRPRERGRGPGGPRRGRPGERPPCPGGRGAVPLRPADNRPAPPVRPTGVRRGLDGRPWRRREPPRMAVGVVGD